MRTITVFTVLFLALMLGTAQAQSDDGFLDGGGGGGLGGDSGGQSSSAGNNDFLEPAPDNGSATNQQSQQGQRRAGQGSGQQQAQNVERFEDWGVRCGLGDGGPRNGCEMFQGVTRNDSNELVMRVAVGYPPREQQIEGPVAVFQLPLGIHLPPGVQLSVDGGEPIRFPVQVCFKPGCRADLPLEDELLAKLKSGSQAKLSLRGPGGQRIDLPISLMGFTAALERISP